MRRRSSERRASGLCADCGEPLAALDPASAKKVCSALCPGSGIWASRIAYASCVHCRESFIVRKSGRGATKCPSVACRRKMAKLERDQRKPAMAQYGKDRRKKRFAEGLCPQCGAPLENLGGKMICSVPCKAPLRATLIAYATCLFCRELFVSRSCGKVSSLCRKRECQRKMGGIRNARHTPSEGARERAHSRARHRTHTKRASVSDITPEQETAMRKRARDCPLCGVRMTDKPQLPNSKELDHIVPVNVGGTHTHGNARIICKRCNVRRPHDGSDFDGQLTLWAQGPAPVSRPRRRGGFLNKGTCRKGLHPWIPENIGTDNLGRKTCEPCRKESYEARYRANHPQETCGCGALFSRFTKGASLVCPACTDAIARELAELHATGLSWDEVAVKSGYSDGESVRHMVYRSGVKAAQPWAGLKGRKRTNAYRPGSHPASIEKGRRAMAMLAQGMTKQAIADTLGYRSASTVNYLIRITVENDSQIDQAC